MHIEVAAPNGHAAGLATAVSSTYEPAVVLFGRDDGGKAHASTFGAMDREVAKAAATLMGMTTWEVTEDHLALVRQMPKGRVFASGKAFVPFVSGKLMAELERLPGRPRSLDPG